MGTHCSSELNRGHIFKSKTTTMKLLLLTVFVAGAFATEEAAKAEEPAAPVAVAPVHHGLRPFYGLWGHQQGWPGIVAPGFSSQCFGCRGKRSAEADAEPGYYGYPYGYYGHPYAYGYGYGHALPGHSYTHVSRVLGKRSAEADAEPGLRIWILRIPLSLWIPCFWTRSRWTCWWWNLFCRQKPPRCWQIEMMQYTASPELLLR